MIIEVLCAARYLDDKLKEKLGRPYHAALGIGLVWEIIERCQELYDAPATSAGIMRLALVILLYLLLLIQVHSDPDHDAVMRIGGEAPGGGPILSVGISAMFVLRFPPPRILNSAVPRKMMEL